MDRPLKSCRKTTHDAASSSEKTVKLSRAATAATLARIRQQVPYCSASALTALVNIIQSEDMPELHRNIDRNLVREGRDAVCTELTPYGRIHHESQIQMTNGEYVDVEIQNPFAMLYKVCRCSESFSQMLLRSLQAHPNSLNTPWGLILYSDEITPGNQLLALNTRKCWAFYWSLHEFGPSVLSDEEAWFEILLYRTVKTKEVLGGMSAMFATVIKQFFNNDAHNMQTSGISLLLPNGVHVRLFVELRYKVADEAALHFAWGSKGSSGLKPCFKCENMFNSKYATGPNSRLIIESDTSNWAVTDKCIDPSRFVTTTKEAILATIDHLASSKATISKTAFEDKCTNLGWNLVPNGVLQDPVCREIVDPVTQTAFDHQHVFMVSGIFSIHIGLFNEFLRTMHPFKVTYAVLYDYCADWIWPARLKGSTGVAALCTERARSSQKAGVFKSSASEARSITPVLRQFVNKTLMQSDDPEKLQHGSCFLLLAEIVELLECIDRRREACVEFKNAVHAYLKSFVVVYGEEHMVEKHHMALHVADQVARFGLGCYVLERKHKNIKKYSNTVVNTNSNWDKSIMRDVTLRHIGVLSDERSVHFNTEACLQNPGVPSKQLLLQLQAVFGTTANISTSHIVRINEFEHCSVGDVVMLLVADGLQACRLKANLSVQRGAGTLILSMVQKWQLIDNNDDHSTWRVQHDTVLCASCDIMLACIYTIDGDIATVLHPKLITL
jgi:hypothetical protein